MGRAGLRRHLVTIQQDTGTTLDTTGGVTPSWTTFCREYVQIEAGEAREFDALRRRYAEATYAVIANYNSKTAAITPKMRVSWTARSKTLEILGTFDPDGRGRELHIAVKEMDVG